YYWKVRARNSTATSDWSVPRTFTTKVNPPTGPLVAHWEMDEISGTTLLDRSEYENNAMTVANPNLVTGVIGQALQFDGSQYATVVDTPSLDISEAITLAAWIKPENGTTQYLIRKAEQNRTNGYELSLSNSGKVFLRFNQNGNRPRLD